MGHCRYGDFPIKKLVCSVLFLAAVGVNAQSGKDWQSELNAAQEAAVAGDKPKAVALYIQYADEGNPLAAFNLGWYAKIGWVDGKVNRKLACDWFLQSAKGDIPIGLQETGHCYRDGILASDSQPQEAIKYYQLAQQVGVFVSACDVLAVELTTLKKSYQQSLAMCEQAAAQNALYAQEILIDLYVDERYLNNNQRALYWLEQAAPKSGKSAYRLALTLHNGENIPEQDIIYWFETAASKGFLPAYLETAIRYYRQITPDLDQQQASNYLAKAYLWSQAWIARKQPMQLTPEWVEAISSEVPASWQKDLGVQIQAHLAKFES